MEDSSGGAGKAATSSWLLSPSRRPSQSSAVAGPASSSTEPTNTQRSRRRRVLGRLVRSGSDPRNTNVPSPFNAEAPDFIPQSLPKTPSKRKASSFSKSGRASQSDSDMAFITPSPTDPPLIRAAEIMFPGQAGLRFTSPSPIPELAMSSSEESDDTEFPNFQLVAPARRESNRTARPGYLNFTSRLRAAEMRKRQDPAHMTSAILLYPEDTLTDVATPMSGASRVRYLPLCPASMSVNGAAAYGTDGASSSLLTVLPSHCDFVQRSERADAYTQVVWPSGELPVELFDLITTHLARDDVKTMRLVNREFEQKVAHTLFHTSVVPFNTEIYDMIDEDRKSVNRGPQFHGKGKAKMGSMPRSMDEAGLGQELGGLQWQNAKEDKEGKVYKGHGLRVFRGFGPHIKRFGMTFEISEQQLAWPPTKKNLDHIQAYYGSYDWPSLDYTRFATLAGLENTADETSRMKAAFSNLEIVQELALSIDSGLGWLNGPDKSLRTLLLDQPTPVFGSSFSMPDRSAQNAQAFWTALHQSQASFDPIMNIKEMTLDHRPCLVQPTEIEGLRDNIYSNTQLWSSISSNKISSVLPNSPTGFGVLYATANQTGSDGSPKQSLAPGCLSKEQREWLLETQWAQQAFLESYMLAVIDNPLTFQNITTLNFARVSSRFLQMLSRDSFWKGLPHLAEVILRISPDWRTVEKDDAGFATTTQNSPSDAVRCLHKEILQGCVAPRQSIKKLTVGWAGGGEHAPGMFARNNNVLPAPITRVEHCTANSSIFGLLFPHVEHLTLTNCWLSPPVLEGLIKAHSQKALKKLTLDSVSLTTHPKFPNFGGAHLLNPQAPPPLALAGAPQQQLTAQQINAMVQQQIAQTQQQLIAHAQANPQAAPAIAQFLAGPPNPHTAPAANSHWTAGYRDGSWPQIIDLISPGTTFQDYRPAPAPWEEQIPARPQTSLRTIEFKSCGYVKLPNHTGFDQLALEAPAPLRATHSAWFRARHSRLKPSMMTSGDRNLGQIVQSMPPREMNALLFAWGFTEGWQDAAKAEEAEFDGFLPGGTGRFSGVVERGMALVGPSHPGTPRI
ncbi:hypothetical protein BDY17DRAFT_294162 [Neohortaea acidophila]|uniref:F-box domain-containing protein n=1 Tax=Neohortaea acidophila TaxID=245834 RepID=A0A6A6Q246_9PEZI|nr:uncharacterized protein BDY17DRAFT_294162 [Neohortaea acidophila]KAF2485743.1 hypothetical protein BDY17DRAFT_294162 [Neohortaea acidophila]